MIRAAAIFLICATAFAVPDSSRLADALRVREGYRGRPGALGEAGPWQIREATWLQHMPDIPFAMAVQEVPARACALKHIAWLSASLEARGVQASPFNVAAAWNAGLDRFLSGRAPVRAYRFAGDVVRIAMAEELHQQAVPVVPVRLLQLVGVEGGEELHRLDPLLARQAGEDGFRFVVVHTSTKSATTSRASGKRR